VSRKHNTKHHRSRSHYPDRLRRRGVSSAAVRMPFYSATDTTRHLQADDQSTNPQETTP
jgi:hypothetical protein